ncbi:MAG TPA: hypothetical protein VK741_23715 [Acetobacteraceae bacterium]|nr:hypothetical protein [Acetobacteraceae bacterium]
MPTKLTVATDWLTELASKLRPSMPNKELIRRVRMTARDLAAKYPIDAFTAASRQAVAEGLTEFPEGAVFETRLGDWWRDHGSKASADGAELPGGDDPTLTREDRHGLKVWLKHRQEGFTHVDGDMARSLSSCRSYRPRVFDHICRTDLEAQRIAMKRGWLTDASAHNREPTEEEIAAVHESAEAAIARLRARGDGPLWPRRSPDAQITTLQSIASPVGRTRADDVALLLTLRRSPTATNRAARIQALCLVLDMPVLETDPPLPPPVVTLEGRAEPATAPREAPEPVTAPRRAAAARVTYTRWTAPHAAHEPAPEKPPDPKPAPVLEGDDIPWVPRTRGR